MPIRKEDEMGVSEYTPSKLKDFETILTTHMVVTSAVINKYPYLRREYLYIDATAGKGLYPDITGNNQLRGSPLIFADNITLLKTPYSAYFINEHQYHLESLSDCLPTDFHCRHLPGSYEQVIIGLLSSRDRYQMGLVYIDSNHVVPPDIKVMSWISKYRPKMEILCYIGANALKRRGKDTLFDYIKGKDTWFIRKSVSGWQYTFLLGTNSHDLFKDKFKSIGMYQITSKLGAEYLQKMAYTEPERKQLWQLPLITEPTQNISGTLNSLRSESKSLTVPMALVNVVISDPQLNRTTLDTQSGEHSTFPKI